MRCTWVSANGIGYGVAVALANLLIAYGIGYGVAVALTYLIATDGISYFVAVATADVRSRG